MASIDEIDFHLAAYIVSCFKAHAKSVYFFFPLIYDLGVQFFTMQHS